jgi:ATP-binding cassette subfamily C protein CydC
VRGLSILRILGRYCERYTGHALTLGLVSRTRSWLFERLFRRIPLPQHLGRADVVSRLVADLDMVDNIFLVALGPMTTAALTAVVMAIGLSVLLPGAALAYALCYLAAALVVPAWLLWRSRQTALTAVAASARLRMELLEGLDGHRDLVLFGQLSRMVGGVSLAANALCEARLHLGRLAANASLAVQLLSGAATIAVLLAALQALQDGRIDGALLVGLLLATLAGFEAAQTLVRSTTRLAASIAAAERVMELAEGEEEGDRSSAPALLPPAAGSIAIRNLTFGYPGQRPVLAGFNLDIAPGEKVALVGSSGSGKSTIASLLVGLIAPQAGVYLLDGADAAAMDVAEVRRRIAIMLQDAPVFCDSVANNLRMGDSDASDSELWAVLQAVGLSDDIRGTGGLDTLVGEGGMSLSTGQARRLALARTLLCKAEIVVLDEPTAGLEPELEASILGMLGRLAGDRTLLVITHAPLLEGFDRTVILH